MATFGAPTGFYCDSGGGRRKRSGEAVWGEIAGVNSLETARLGTRFCRLIECNDYCFCTALFQNESCCGDSRRTGPAGEPGSRRGVEAPQGRAAGPVDCALPAPAAALSAVSDGQS